MNPIWYYNTFFCLKKYFIFALPIQIGKVSCPMKKNKITFAKAMVIDGEVAQMVRAHDS